MSIQNITIAGLEVTEVAAEMDLAACLSDPAKEIILYKNKQSEVLLGIDREQGSVILHDYQFGRPVSYLKNILQSVLPNFSIIDVGLQQRGLDLFQSRLGGFGANQIRLSRAQAVELMAKSIQLAGPLLANTNRIS